ncbi:ComEA family DNA-binding protein [Alkalibaculum sp. M08DMB]|uniref:ComEA family DNA-binding protein n=1 Tax=Alkalibaculum sporogenes TaxID=2655001 RepID=A0A6A7K5G3_9FIRM|nr:helix-hairpin-helix domain-containing protein [Alkalibaculum sporogenes]MPW24625.1 ComEA family DNA-binding protein [Alkalibaculum sporogenes]
MDKNKLLYNKKVTMILSIVIVTILLIYYYTSLNSSNIKVNEGIIELEDPEQEVTIFIHISGEVKNPGIVELLYGQRLYEALELIGGTTIEADIDQVNLAMIVEDQQKIVIPSKNENSEFEKNREEGMININTADLTELTKLPGIGETIANNIVIYRQDNNGFRKIDEIKNVSRIGDVTFEKIKDMITCY